MISSSPCSAQVRTGALHTAQGHPRTLDRNCISNVRPAGLPYANAVHKLVYLLGAARDRGLSGVALKDEESVDREPMIPRVRPVFLLPPGGV